MKIELPNNGYGIAIMLTVMALIAIVPFVIALWLTLKIAPWWVAVPVAAVASVTAFIITVKPRKP